MYHAACVASCAMTPGLSTAELQKPELGNNRWLSPDLTCTDTYFMVWCVFRTSTLRKVECFKQAMPSPFGEPIFVDSFGNRVNVTRKVKGVSGGRLT